MQLGSAQSEVPALPSKKRLRVGSITEAPSVLYDVVIARRMLMIVWMTVGIVPLLLQGRSYWKFVTPHKLTKYLVVPDEAQEEVASIEAFCPVEGVFVSHAWWNIEITHYYSVEQRQICHFVIPQYNIHGAYILGTEKVEPFSTAPERCANDSFYFEHYFYHGSLGYYAFYEEGVGTYCKLDKTAYVRVRGVGTLDMNGARLANDKGDFGYRCSYWYGLFGAVWISYRAMMLRKSYILCKQYGRRCDRMNEKLRRKNAVVFMQECMRLSAHGTTNYHRLMMMYLLVEGLMSDLFLLIAQDGILSRLQYLSLGYNLAGVLSMLFEIFESMHWIKENTRLLLKRLLFSYETSLLGEFLSAGLMHHYLTWINRSSLRHSRPTALAVSYYVWSLIGHGIIVLGLTGFVVCVRVTSVAIYAWRVHRTLKVLTASCCVDTTLGVRSKMILLGGYLWEEGKLYYKVDALKSFGILKMVEKDGTEFFVIRTVHWIRVPRHDLLVIGQVFGHRVEPCSERLCTGRISLFDRFLGGDLNRSESPRNRIIRVGNRVASGPQPLSVLPSYKIPTTTASKAKATGRHPARIGRQNSYQKN